MERFFDIIFAGLALLALSPFFVLIILILKFSGEGEVFFFQERIGKDGKLFKLYKFATMLKDSPIWVLTVTMRDDPRVLPVGKFLRKTKINELPQLLNIFWRNECYWTTPYSSNLGSYSDTTKVVISQVMPGLSGVGSIKFRIE